MYRTLAAVLILAATLVMGQVYLSRSTPPAEVPEASVSTSTVTTLPSEATLAALRAELAALQRQAARDRARLDRVLTEAGSDAGPEVGPAAAPATAAVDPAMADAAAARGLAEARAFAAALDQRMALDGEPAPDWAGDAVRRRLADRGIADAALTHSHCTTSLCRLDFQFDSEDAKDALLMNIGESLPDAEGFFFSDPAAPLMTQVFVAPEGTALVPKAEG